MSYLGKVALKASDIRRLDVTSSTSATHTLTWTPPNEQSLIITINGVKQQNNYSISGVTLTLDSALVATDEMEVIGINDIGTTTVPGDGTVTTAKIEDDAVTADKLANSINTEIAANTAKVTNATHTGDVTGATALTIAADAVDIAMLSATGTADATTFLRGDNAWAAPAGGDNTPSFQARKTSTQSSIASDTYTKIGFETEDWDTDSAYDHSTNYRFTVPAGEGGKYFVHAQFMYYANDGQGKMLSSTIAVYKNGSATEYKWYADWRSGYIYFYTPMATCTISLAAADYIEIYAKAETVSGTLHIDNNWGYFGAYKLIGV